MKGFLGEQLYRLYKVILKLVLTIVPTVLMTITFFVQLAHFEFGLEGIFSQIIGLCIHILITLIHALIISFIWVTVVFFLLKICSFPIDGIDIDSLENLVLKRDKNHGYISKSDCLFNMIGIVFLIWLICFQPQWIASYHVLNGQLQIMEPLFNVSVLRGYHPLIFIIYGFGLLYYWCKLMLGRWSFKLLIFQLVYKVSACFLFCMMMLNQTLFNERFFTTLFSFSHSNWTIDWYVSSRVLIVISVVSLVIEMSRSFLEYSKHH